jgi:hypothetical protein
MRGWGTAAVQLLLPGVSTSETASHIRAAFNDVLLCFMPSLLCC